MQKRRRGVWRRIGSVLCAAAMVVTGAVNPWAGTDMTVHAEEKHTVWVVGDSTVSAFNDNYYYPRYGWGTKLGEYLDDTMEVKNLAASGTSSKSFMENTGYTTMKEGIKEGDFLLIGFGHNDEKAEEARYTNPNGDYQTEGSFAKSLYDNYVKVAIDKGATPVLCTPIVRRTTDGNWSNSQLHITSDSGEFKGGDYPQAIRDLGTAVNVAVVDMTKKTKNLYDSMGPTGTLKLHAWLSEKETSVDNTHTNVWGGTYNAYLVAKEIKELNVAGLADHVTADAAPGEDILKSNPDYKPVEYTGELADSELFEDAGIWKGTAFGDVGGTPTTANYILSGDGNTVNIAVKNNKGKIGSSDGIAMYYYKVPVGKQFSLSATMKVNSMDSNDQVSFGLMARDAMWIDTNTKDPLGDYVAAAPLKLTMSGAQWCCFARKSGTLTQNTAKTVLASDIKAGESYKLSIVSNTDGYACSINDQTVSDGFDFNLTSIDSDSVYVGMFAARNADVTFTDIELLIDGQAPGESGNTEDPKSVTEIFGDVSDTEWYVKAVQFVYDNKIMAGTSSDSFRPSDTLTREQFAQVLYNHTGKPDVSLAENPFSDVVETEWYRKAVFWAKENNIASGNANGTFGVGDPITREQLAQMLYKYAKANSYNTTVKEDEILKFDDNSSVSTWAVEAMNWAVTQEVMSGKPRTNHSGEAVTVLDPQGNATRAECASMIRKMLLANQ